MRSCAKDASTAHCARCGHVASPTTGWFRFPPTARPPQACATENSGEYRSAYPKATGFPGYHPRCSIASLSEGGRLEESAWGDPPRRLGEIVVTRAVRRWRGFLRASRTARDTGLAERSTRRPNRRGVRHIRSVIIGAGPGGLQLAYFLARRREAYVVLERAAEPGSFFAAFPRHRQLISVNKVLTGDTDRESRLRYDWNSLLNNDDDLIFPKYTSKYFPHPDVLRQYLIDFSRRFALDIEFDSEVMSVDRSETGTARFVVRTRHGGTLYCERLFVGTGLWLPNLPVIGGLDLCDRYATVSVDPERYRDRTVIVVGAGNSAFETAEPLIPLARQVRICGPAAVTPRPDGNYLDPHHLKFQDNVLNGRLVSVRRDGEQKLSANIHLESKQRDQEFSCDHVILCTGFRFDTTMFTPACLPRMVDDGRLPEMTSQWESTNLPGMFFVGTLMQLRDTDKATSGFINGFRHDIRALDQMLDYRDGGPAWRNVLPVSATPDAVARLVIERVSTAAAMVAQPGFMGDCIAVLPGGTVEYLCDIPVGYLQERLADQFGQYCLATLEYRDEEGVVPVMRRFVGRSMMARADLVDEPDNDWRNRPEYLTQLTGLFAGMFDDPTGAPRAPAADPGDGLWIR